MNCTAYLGTGGKIIFVQCSAPPSPSGIATVTINGVVVACPLSMVIHSDLYIRLPDSSVQTTNSASIALSVPGVTAAPIAVVNYAGVDRLTTTVKGDPTKLQVGINTFSPSYYGSATLFSDGVRQASWEQGFADSQFNMWNVSSGTNLTCGPTGLPQSISGATSTFTVTGAGATWTQGQYLLRWSGLGSASLLAYHNTGTLKIISTGVAPDGCNWAIVDNTGITGGAGWRINVVPPITGLELFCPGSFNPATGTPTSYYSPLWSVYEPFAGLRFMDAIPVNNSNLARFADVKPSNFISDGMTGPTYTGTVTASVPSTSVFLSGYASATNPVWLVTHNAPGDPFVSGQVLSKVQGTFTGAMIERISPTQFKVCQPVAPAVGTVVGVTPQQCYSWETIARIANHFNQFCWISVPHLLEPRAIYDMAQRLCWNLKPGIKCRVELSNELWNLGTFIQGHFATALGTVAGQSGYGAFIWGVAKLASQAHTIFREVFNAEGRGGDLVCVLGYQASGDFPNGQALVNSYLSMTGGVYPDEFAVAPYFGGQADPIATPSIAPFCNGLVANDLIDIAHRDLESPTGVGQSISKWTPFLTSTPMKLVCYEASSGFGGGEGLTSGFGAASATAFTQETYNANRDPRMQYLHWIHMGMLRDAGYSLKMHFCTVSNPWTPDSMWSVQEYPGQPLTQTPTLQALQTWISTPAPVSVSA